MSASGHGSLAACDSVAAHALRHDVQMELEAHLELAVDDLVAAGETPERARAEALRRFGDLDRIAGRCLAQKGKGMIAMNRTIVLLGSTIVLITGLLFYVTLQQRRVAVEQLVAERLVAQRAQPLVLGADERARASDTIRLSTSGLTPELEVEVRVDTGGMVLLPHIGRLKVTDKTRAELEALVNASYEHYYAQPAPIYVILERSLEF